MGSVYYTLEEISKNNGKDGYNTWIIIKNGVYDVTDYLKKDEVGTCIIYYIIYMFIIFINCFPLGM